MRNWRSYGTDPLPTPAEALDLRWAHPVLVPQDHLRALLQGSGAELGRARGNQMLGAMAKSAHTHRVRQPLEIPARIGPVEFSMLGGMVAVRCPHELEQRAGALWEPGARRWLIEPRRIGPVIRELRRVTDPLFRHAGLDLNEGVND